MALADGCLVCVGREALGSVVADRFEHGQPGGRVPVRAASEQALGNKAIERVEVRGGDGFSRMHGGAAGKHGKPRKARLLGVTHQVVASINGRAQRLLARGRVAGAGAERGIQAFSDLAG